MATTRARKQDARPLSATEQRWLLDQLHRRQSSSQPAAEAAVSEEASSMIVRPGITATEPVAPVAPGAAGSLPARIETEAERAPEPTRSTHRAVPAVAVPKYRAVFACCMQAGDAPTEQSPS